MRSKNKKKLKLNNIFLIIYLIINIIFISFLMILNILPNKFLYPVLGIILILYIIVFILVKKKKKIGYVLLIILSIIYSFITYYLGVTKNFFSSFSDSHYKEETYLVVVLDNSPYKKLKDLNNKKIGYIENNLTGINKALDKLNKSIDKEGYTSDNELFKDLDNENIDSILIDETYYNIKDEEEDLTQYRIIDKIKIRTLVKNKNKEVDITKDPFTIYISGIDVYGSIETVSRSDVNILMTINPKTKQILLTNIPRDYYVQLHDTTGYKDKLTHAGNYGVDMSVKTIEDFLGIDINYYIRVNFTTLEKLIDSINGVDVYSKYSFVSYIDNYKFYTGYNHMNGKQALAFARERKALPEGDNDRGRNQEAVIEAIIRKATSKSIIYNYTKILNNLNNSFQTNLKDTDITKLIKKELEHIGGWTITSNSLTGTGDNNYTYSYSASKLYVTIPDEESIKKASDLINKVISGKLLESSYNNKIDNIKYPDKVEEKPQVPEVKEEVKPTEEKKEDKDNNITKDDDSDEDILKDNNILPNEDDDNKEEDNNTTEINNNENNKDDSGKENDAESE